MTRRTLALVGGLALAVGDRRCQVPVPVPRARGLRPIKAFARPGVIPTSRVSSRPTMSSACRSRGRSSSGIERSSRKRSSRSARRRPRGRRRPTPRSSSCPGPAGRGGDGTGPPAHWLERGRTLAAHVDRDFSGERTHPVSQRRGAQAQPPSPSTPAPPAIARSTDPRRWTCTIGASRAGCPT